MFGIEAAFEGRLGRSPELKMVKGGTMAMTILAVAVDEAPPKDGQDTKSSTWVSVKLFGDKAKVAAEALAKGDRVYVEGRLSMDSWEKDGQPRHGLSLMASEAKALGKIGQRRPRPAGQNATSTEHQRRAAADSQRPLDRHDDMQNDPIPF